MILYESRNTLFSEIMQFFCNFHSNLLSGFDNLEYEDPELQNRVSENRELKMETKKRELKSGITKRSIFVFAVNTFQKFNVTGYI